MPLNTSKYEIPGFEGFNFANGYSSDVSKKILSNHDALALIIDEICTTSRYADSSPAAPLWAIRGKATRWRLRDMHSGSDYSSWFGSSYFNSSYAYGHVGADINAKGTLITKFDYKTRTHRNIVVPTYWYRTSHEHYALTVSGQQRVAELRTLRVVPAVAQTQTAPLTRATRAGCGAPPKRVFTIAFTVPSTGLDAQELLNLAVRAVQDSDVLTFCTEACEALVPVCTP